MIEKGAVFESIFNTTNKFSKDEFYELIAYASTLDNFKIKIMKLKKEKDKNTEVDNNIIYTP